jgi:hypothetical protein
MSVDLNEDTLELLADKFLNKLPANDWAIKALERGFDSKNLRILASMLPIDSTYEINEREQMALAELGWDSVPAYLYMIQWARSIAKEILSDKTDPIKASEELYRILCSADAHFELGAWYSIDESLWSLAYFKKTGERDSFFLTEEAILSAIKSASEDFLRKTDSNIVELSGTTFERAETLYKNFLKTNNIGTKLNWIFREDCIADGWDVSIKTPLPTGNRQLAKQCFELGKQRNLGITITTSCTLNGDPCCFVQLPKDDTDDVCRQLGNRFIKFTFYVNLSDVRQVRNTILRNIKQLFERKRDYRYWIDEVPSRYTLLPKYFKQ